MFKSGSGRQIVPSTNKFEFSLEKGRGTFITGHTGMLLYTHQTSVLEDHFILQNRTPVNNQHILQKLAKKEQKGDEVYINVNYILSTVL